MIVSNDEEAIKKMRFWATQSREPAKHYEHKEVGYNYRMSNICAGIGRGQLEVLDERIMAKEKIRERYKKEFENLPLSLMPISTGNASNYWLSVIKLNNNSSTMIDDIIGELESNNIESRHTWKPMSLQPIFNECLTFTHYYEKSFGNELFLYGVCLPSGSNLSLKMQDMIITKIKGLFK